MEGLEDKLKGTRVLVVGDICLDCYWKGDASRISPEAPVPVLKVVEEGKKPGGAANVAVNLTALGAKCDLIGAIGSDSEGKELKDLLKKAKVNWELIESSNSKTIVKYRMMAKGQQLIRIDREELKLSNHDYSFIKERFETLVSDVDVVVLSDYGKGLLKYSKELIEIANNKNVKVLVDPKGNDYSKYNGSYIITPNTKEFIEVAGSWEDMEGMNQCAIDLLENNKITNLLVTRSEKGMSLFKKHEKRIDFAVTAREVYDVTGAGDTVIAMIAICIGAGIELKRSVELSNIAAGIVVGRLGTAAITLKEIQNNKDSVLQNQKIIKLDEALNYRVKWKEKGIKVVMTNGCFDILHYGHIKYLEEAKLQGDLLCVLVNSDESIKHLKGEERPVNVLMDRMKLLEALECVDYVIPFYSETPLKEYNQLLPDILVKGGDYEIKDIVGAEAVINNGGTVRKLSFVKGYSTSEIIDYIKDS